MMILDMRMPGMKGVEVLKELYEKVIQVSVIVPGSLNLNFSYFVEKIGFMGYTDENAFFKLVKLDDLLKHVNKSLGKLIKKKIAGSAE